MQSHFNAAVNKLIAQSINEPISKDITKRHNYKQVTRCVDLLFKFVDKNQLAEQNPSKIEQKFRLSFTYT